MILYETLITLNSSVNHSQVLSIRLLHTPPSHTHHHWQLLSILASAELGVGNPRALHPLYETLVINETIERFRWKEKAKALE